MQQSLIFKFKVHCQLLDKQTQKLSTVTLAHAVSQYNYKQIIHILTEKRI